ncbi:magnesium transporter mgtE [Mycobacteroides abscessus subsp. abscessus]|nr:magnesium transporter mgtE [Mycobacteroides abscessus subsp. abscessus]
MRNLLVYQESTAGAMMTPEPVILGVDSTVADALARVRLEELTPALASMVFVCRSPLDVPSGRYIGAVHVQRLLREPPSVPVVGMVDGVVAPVVDESQRLIGAITVDDVLDHMLPEDWRGDQMDGTDPDEVSNG